MNESTDSIGGGAVRTLRTVQLVGFSTRDRELLRLFLRRPPGAGVSLSVVENQEDGDLLICNAASTPAVRTAKMTHSSIALTAV